MRELSRRNLSWLALGCALSTLVLAGCTLSSCVRVSALEVQRLMGGIGGLQVVVDRALCGARRSNYYSSQEFGGRSSVEAAIQEMEGEGVRVVTGFFQP